MTSWNDVPVFGEPSSDRSNRVRPCAYAIIADAAGRIALVQTPVGVFLPGGGIDDDETVAQAILREALEEGGLEVRVGAWTVRAVQFADSSLESTCFEKRSTFVSAEIVGPKRAALEKDHELVWSDTHLAQALLSYDSHSWAIELWRNQCRPTTRMG